MVIVAAGNTGTEALVYPGALDTVVAVGAVDVGRQIANFSTQGNAVDLCQIGVDVPSADAHGTGYVNMSGTSMASPKVAGIAALLISKSKQQASQYDIPLTGVQMEYAYYKALKYIALDLGVAGTDKLYGAGFCTFNQKLLTTVVFKQNSSQATVNGVVKTLPAPCSLYVPQGSPDGYTMVPLRSFNDFFGISTAYNNTTKEITAQG
jgi:major intracellular serine protease